MRQTYLSSQNCFLGKDQRNFVLAEFVFLFQDTAISRRKRKLEKSWLSFTPYSAFRSCCSACRTSATWWHRALGNGQWSIASDSDHGLGKWKINKQHCLSCRLHRHKERSAIFTVMIDFSLDSYIGKCAATYAPNHRKNDGGAILLLDRIPFVNQGNFLLYFMQSRGIFRFVTSAGAYRSKKMKERERRIEKFTIYINKYISIFCIKLYFNNYHKNRYINLYKN